MQNLENPLNISEIAFLEFACLKDTKLIHTAHQLGLAQVASSEDGKLLYYQHARVRFLFNIECNSQCQEHLAKHGEGVMSIVFATSNAEKSFSTAISRGAQEKKHPLFLSISGVGDLYNGFVDEKNSIPPLLIKKERPAQCPLEAPFLRIDHLTNNVPKGEMNKWFQFYASVFGMEETRYFHIQGSKTGLHSKVVQLKNGAVMIPINEPDEFSSKSQIQEYLDEHRGAGVQHIALTSQNIAKSVESLRSRGIEFLSVPATYYHHLPKRQIPKVMDVENITELAKLHILVDGDETGYLLQIFSKNIVGPLFLEIICRKGHRGFGEGNFQALFDAIEADQAERGYL